MKTVEPALAEGTALVARPSARISALTSFSTSAMKRLPHSLRGFQFFICISIVLRTASPRTASKVSQ